MMLVFCAGFGVKGWLVVLVLFGAGFDVGCQCVVVLVVFGAGFCVEPRRVVMLLVFGAGFGVGQQRVVVMFGAGFYVRCCHVGGVWC